MTRTNRREAMKQAAGLALAAGAVTGGRAVGQEPAPAPRPKGRTDSMLAMALENPQAFMLGEPVTFKIEGDGYSRDLVLTPALNVDGKPAPVSLRSSTMCVFRADASMDAFTKGGGLYWRFHNKSGKVKLPTAGEIVMVVREGYDTVRCYTMHLDFRC